MDFHTRYLQIRHHYNRHLQTWLFGGRSLREVSRGFV